MFAHPAGQVHPAGLQLHKVVQFESVGFELHAMVPPQVSPKATFEPDLAHPDCGHEQPAGLQLHAVAQSERGVADVQVDVAGAQQFPVWHVPVPEALPKEAHVCTSQLCEAVLKQV